MDIREGDIFESKEQIVLNAVNCGGVMNTVLGKRIRQKYPLAFTRFKVACDLRNKRNLGKMQIVAFKDRIICNIFTQIGVADYGTMIDYTAFSEALSRLRNFCKDENYSIAIPYKIAGGDWVIVSSIIHSELKGLDYTIYK